MITFEKKAGPRPVPDEREENRFERIRKAAKEKRLESDADEARRPARPAAPDGRLF